MTNQPELSDRLPKEMLALPQRVVAHIKEYLAEGFVAGILAAQVLATSWMIHDDVRRHNYDYCKANSGRSPFIYDAYIDPRNVITPWTFQRCDRVLEAEQK